MYSNLFEPPLWYVCLRILKLAKETEHQICPKVQFNKVIEDQVKRVGRFGKCNVVHGRETRVPNQQENPNVKNGFVFVIASND